MTGSDELPKAAQAAILLGFHSRGHGALLEPYARAYVEVVEPLWEARSTEKAMLVASALYPREVVSADTLAVVDAWLDSPGRPAACRRLVSEGRDETSRALRARAADA